MSVHDYLIDQTDFDWRNLLAGWTWLLPSEFTVWLMDRFGDLFLTLPDGSVHRLDVGAGTLTKLADSQDEFCQNMDEGDHANEWLSVPLVDRLVSAGVHLLPGTCYGYRVLPALGGTRTVENVTVVGIVEHYRTCGAILNGLRGARSEWKIKKDE
jgi:hypothetical protein